MAEHDEDPRGALVWTDAHAAPLVADIVERFGAAAPILGVGGPRSREVDDLAKSLGVPRYDDPRHTLLDKKPATWLLASTDQIEPEHLSLAATRGVAVLSLAPLAPGAGGAACELAAWKPKPAEAPAPEARLRIAPALLAGDGYLDAADPEQAVGPAHSVHVEIDARPQDAPLSTLLLDAWASALRFAALPDAIDASLDRPPAAGVSVGQLTGALHAHARLPGRGAVTLVIRGNAPRFARRIRVQGADATLELTDTGYALWDANGQALDQETNPEALAHTTTRPPADLIANQWRRLLERRAKPDPYFEPRTWARALACAEACVLSARTQSAERPETLLRVAGFEQDTD
ncbi:MAG: hypothetical protein AAF612_04255 [Planctomycetota bacterium]